MAPRQVSHKPLPNRWDGRLVGTILVESADLPPDRCEFQSFRKLALEKLHDPDGVATEDSTMRRAVRLRLNGLQFSNRIGLGEALVRGDGQAATSFSQRGAEKGDEPKALRHSGFVVGEVKLAGVPSIQKTSVCIDATVAEERPDPSKFLQISKIAIADEDFLLIDGSLAEKFAIGIADE